MTARFRQVGVLCLTLGLAAAAPGISGAQAFDHGHPAHVCGTDLSSPEALRALDDFRQARDAGLLVRAAKTASPPDIGDRRTFRVSEDSWVEMEFELLDKEDGLYYLWAEVGEISTGRITPEVVAGLRTALVESTPGSIINEDAGVMANNEAVLGPPPDYDGDGMTDVLMYDIQPSAQNAGSYVAGYVHSSDINPNASPTQGNQADILYLDSNQGIRNNSTASTAAHEYAHLIHFATGFDTETFISEGIAEYLTVVNNLGRSRYSFLGLSEETSKPLFSWGTGTQITRDYARAELFFRYIGEQHSPQAVAQIAANTAKGADGIDAVLRSLGTSLDETVLDYHSANLVHELRMGGAFSYGPGVEATGARATVHTTWSGAGSAETPAFEQGQLPGVESGAVNYIEFTNVADLHLVLDAAAAPIILDAARETISARAFFQDELGTWSASDIETRSQGYVFPGNFYRVRLVVANVKPGRTFQTRYDYAASWLGFGQATSAEDPVEIPGETALEQNYPNPFNPTTRIRFRLESAGPAHLYVVDALGRRVATLADGHHPSGDHEVSFRADRLPSGSYLGVLEADGQRLTIPMLLVR